MKEHSEAENCFREAINLDQEIQTESGSSTLSEEALTIFCAVQKLFLMQGQPDLSEKILTEEAPPLL